MCVCVPRPHQAVECRGRGRGWGEHALITRAVRMCACWQQVELQCTAAGAHLAVRGEADGEGGQGVAGHALAHPASGGHVLVAGNSTSLQVEEVPR